MGSEEEEPLEEEEGALWSSGSVAAASPGVQRLPSSELGSGATGGAASARAAAVEAADRAIGEIAGNMT